MRPNRQARPTPTQASHRYGRAAAHVRGNVVGYLALFVALGGSAWAANTVGSRDVVNNSLKSVDLKDGTAVTGADVVEGSLTGSDLGPGEIGSGQLGASSVVEAKLADGAVANDKVKDGAVTGAKIDTFAVSSSKILPNAVTSSKIAAAAVDGDALGAINDRSNAQLLDPGVHTISVNCSAGEQIVSGGFSEVANMVVRRSFMAGNGWTVRVSNGTNQLEPITAHAYCLQA